MDKDLQEYQRRKELSADAAGYALGGLFFALVVAFLAFAASVIVRAIAAAIGL